MAAVKAVHGTVFDPINSADLCKTFVTIAFSWQKYDWFHKDPASGASDDWYKEVLQARFTYTVELRDTGKNGFILPANQIIPRYEKTQNVNLCIEPD